MSFFITVLSFLLLLPVRSRVVVPEPESFLFKIIRQGVSLNYPLVVHVLSFFD